MKEALGQLLSLVIPWIIPAVLLGSFLVNTRSSKGQKPKQSAPPAKKQSAPPTKKQSSNTSELPPPVDTDIEELVDD